MTHEEMSNDPLELIQIEWSLRRRVAEQETHAQALREELGKVLIKLDSMPTGVVEAARHSFVEKLKKSGVDE